MPRVLRPFRHGAVVLTVLVLGAVWAAASLSPTFAQRPTFPEAPDPAADSLEVLPVQGKVWLVAGAGGNITVQVGDDGLIVVDTGLTSFSERVLAELRRLSPKPVRMIVSTSVAPDHIGGNDAIAKTGEPLYLAQNSGGVTIPGAQIVGHERAALALSRLTGARAVPAGLWPFDTFFGRLKTVFANGEPIEVHYQPAAVGDGDVMVFFRGSDVVSAGDVYDTTRYPRFDADAGGSLQGILDALNHIIAIAVPAFNQIGGTRVVPGHGRISNESDVVEYRDMATIVRDRIKTLADQGRTLEQVKAAGVTRDYDGIYGATSGSWTTDMFIEAVYREVRRTTATR
jgi:glyoxylase-like metal-dependent hydrolase (beta-lactamase superfamily II)